MAVVDQGEQIAAHPAHVGGGHRQHRAGGHRGVGGRPARPQHGHPGRRGQVIDAAHHGGRGVVGGERRRRGRARRTRREDGTWPREPPADGPVARRPGRGRRRRDHVITDPERTAAGHGGLDRPVPGRDPGRGATRPRPTRWPRCWPTATTGHLAVVPQGGNTGLVGGGVPLATARWCSTCAGSTRIGPVDALARQVTVGAGVTAGRAAPRPWRPTGLAYAVDFAARDTATVGGTIATNAGGVHVLRWGTTRAQVAGHRGGAGRRPRAAPPGRPGQGQHGLRPGRPAVRQRGHPGRGHRGPPAPGAPTSPTSCVALRRLRLGGRRRGRRVAPGASTVRRASPRPSSCWPTGSTWCASAFDRRPPLPGAWPVVVLVEARADVDGAAAAALGRRAGRGSARVRGSVVAHRPRRRRAAVVLPRRPHAGHQHARSAPQAGRDPAPGRPGRLRGRGARRWWPARGARGPGVAVRPPRRRQHPRQRDRARPRRRDASTRRCWAWWPERGGSISAEHGIGAAKRALAGASTAHRPRSTRSAAIKARPRPRRHPQPARAVPRRATQPPTH